MPYSVTPPQRKLLDFIIAYTAEHRTAPNFDEMLAALGHKSKSTIVRLLGGLKERGHVDWIPYRERSVTVLEPPRLPIALPANVAANLARFCLATGDTPADVIADAVAFHLDEMAIEEAAS